MTRIEPEHRETTEPEGSCLALVSDQNLVTEAKLTDY
ncbi:BnaA09g47160D [Brassica napus]|uniref:BnaA09g47160D protein n=1 Tax=Brassica napus TaxID=3708 RepID=A0A078GMN8_BRANA|nr:BnaA09g47160D [Brassica napus]